MNSLFVLLAVQTLVSILLIVWVRLKVMRSLDDGDSITRVRREIGALIIELDGSADRNITLIEDRLRELKDCIAEADKRIVMLSNERARTWVTPPVSIQRAPLEHINASQDQQLASLLPTPTTQPPVPAAPSPVMEAPQLAPEGQLTATTAQQPVQSSREPGMYGGARTASVPFIRFSDKPLVFEEPFTERVARLYKRGFSSDIIAAKLKATIAEVDLAISAGCIPPEGRGEG